MATWNLLKIYFFEQIVVSVKAIVCYMETRKLPDAIRQKHSQEYFQSKIGRKKEKEKGVHTQRAFERDEWKNWENVI